MTIFDRVFPLGLGTNRFPVKNAQDEEGMELSAQIVAEAISSGVNYIDVAHTYSRGMAQEILRRAFRQTGGFEDITIKTRLNLDRTENDVRRRAEGNLQAMGLSRATYFYCWSVMSLQEFEALFQKGGIYDGAVKLCDEGMVKHLCFSVHAPVDDILKMLKRRAFEAVTISFSLLNSLRYVLAHKGIQIVLSGVSTQEELRENLASISNPSPEPPDRRILRVDAHLMQIKDFCTGCNYCNGCPQKIPISAIMQCRNYLTFGSRDPNYTFAAETVQENIFALGKLEQEHSVLFETTENPCIRCGMCERVCTQHLNIMDAIADTYRRAKGSSFSIEARVQLLHQIIDNKRENIVGMYPSGITCLTVRQFYEKHIGPLHCRLVLFDSNPAVWGKEDVGIPIYAPEEIPNIKPSVVIITSYKFKNEIYEAIKQYEADGVRIVKLYTDNELPWLL